VISCVTYSTESSKEKKKKKAINKYILFKRKRKAITGNCLRIVILTGKGVIIGNTGTNLRYLGTIGSDGITGGNGIMEVAAAAGSTSADD
jgi:hypothetical protein